MRHGLGHDKRRHHHIYKHLAERIREIAVDKLKIVKDISQTSIGKNFAIKLVKKVVQQELATSTYGEYNKALFVRKTESLFAEKEPDDLEYNIGNENMTEE